MPISLPPIKGRGAPGNDAPVRTGSALRVPDGDWLDMQPLLDPDPAPLRTTVTIEHPRTIITRNTSPDISFDRSINAYRGCEHGCIYCYARPSHAFHDLSPGLDFETRLFAKADAAQLLRRELAKPGYAVQPVAVGTNTDPFQPIESEYRISRAILEVLLEVRHPVIITTKSCRILQDMDLLQALAEQNLVGVAISVTTLDPKIARTLEPRASHPRRRLAAIAALNAAGVPTQVNIAPVIPAITDHEIEAILSAAAEAHAVRASYIQLRLPHEVAPLFRAWLDAHYPDRAAKVMAILQDMRGGRDNDPRFGHRMRASGVWADLTRARFRRATRAVRLDGKFPPLRCDLFVPPERDGQMRFW